MSAIEAVAKKRFNARETTFFHQVFLDSCFSWFLHLVSKNISICGTHLFDLAVCEIMARLEDNQEIAPSDAKLRFPCRSAGASFKITAGYPLIRGPRNQSTTSQDLLVRRSVDLITTLPTELILKITEDLPPTTLLSLSFTCRHFRNNFKFGDLLILYGYSTRNYNLGSRNLFGQSFHLDEVLPHEQRLFFLMMERDALLFLDWALCKTCQRRHHRSLFGARAWAQKGGERKCKGTEGRLWICPDMWLGLSRLGPYLDIVQYMQVPSGGEGVAPCISSCGDQFHKTTLKDCTTRQEIYIIEATREVPVSPVLAAATLKRINIKVCNHARLGDRAIVRPFDSNLAAYMFFEWNCNKCSVRVMFETKLYDRDGFRFPNFVVESRVILLAIIAKNFSKVDSPLDPAWLAMISSAGKCARREREWCHASLEASGRNDEDLGGICCTTEER